MHATILFAPVLADTAADTELFADKLLQRLHRVLLNIAGRRVVSEGRVMVLNLIDHEWVAPQQVNGFPDLRIVRVIRRVHGFVNCIMQDDLKG